MEKALKEKDQKQEEKKENVNKNLKEVIIMPGYNGFGPAGRGPLTGRGFGYCRKGCGRGFRRGFGRGSRNFGFYDEPFSRPLTNEEEKKILQEELKDIEDEKKAIEEKLKEIKD